jgi:aryl-alcohol dehydrogenase-like predicted oxidoreductase
MLPTGSQAEVARRTFLKAAVGAGVAACATTRAAGQEPKAAGVEWRNKQPGMAYRQLGRTGMMISEVVSGGDPITLENYKQLELALEMGLNYLDMAPQYNRGDTERAYGKLIASSSKRDKVFLTTKVSRFGEVRNRLYRELFDGLPGAKQEAIALRARDLRSQRGVEKPGYFIEYFPNQMRQLEPAYLSNAMAEEYSPRVEGSKAFRDFITQSIEGSLERVGTDHFDILMCPHGACTPEELQIPEIRETFEKLKQQGKVRFLGVSSHNDPAGILRTATELGHYDVVMMAYNVINGGYLEHELREAKAKGVGVIAMKVAHAVATHHKPLQPIPQWRIDKVNRIVPGDMKPPMKAYLWALQNPNISAVISNLWDETFVRENLSLAGKKVELQAA